MSNLLEEAIVDAAALRETALKSAHETLVEKYKDEFLKSLEKLTEQDEPATDTPETTPQDAAAAVPDAQAAQAAPTPEQPEEDEAFSDVPSSFLDGDDEELITIDFDKLKKQLSSELGSSPMLASPEQPAPETPEASPQQPAAISEEMELDEELFQEYVLDEEESCAEEEQEEQEELEEEVELEEGTADSVEEGLAANAVEELKSDSESLEEEFELTEEEINELEETLKVDLNPKHQLRGWKGQSSAEKEIDRNVEFAAARDDEEEERRKEEEEKVKDLEYKLEESKKENSRLSNLIEELKDNLIMLKEHTEKLSLSNAKLLYINKVFGNVSLNERQKQNIVENISNAKSVLEAKTIYGTLQSTVQSVSEMKPRESLSEALNRGSSGFISRPRASGTDAYESDRMKILAGIK